MAAEGSVYLSGENLEELHELLEGGFLIEEFNFKRIGKCYYCRRKRGGKESLSV